MEVSQAVVDSGMGRQGERQVAAVDAEEVEAPVAANKAAATAASAGSMAAGATAALVAEGRVEMVARVVVARSPRTELVAAAEEEMAGDEKAEVVMEAAVQATVVTAADSPSDGKGSRRRGPFRCEGPPRWPLG